MKTLILKLSAFMICVIGGFILAVGVFLIYGCLSFWVNKQDDYGFRSEAPNRYFYLKEFLKFNNPLKNRLLRHAKKKSLEEMGSAELFSQYKNFTFYVFLLSGLCFIVAVFLTSI